ncbi:MAG: type II secretion system minor pseudopilin GspJ [Rhodothalassiaceae bacterium]
MTRGFTLVEMLVALTVFAILAAAGVGVLQGAVSAQDRIEAADDRLRRLQIAHALIRSDLAQISLRRRRIEDGRLSPYAMEAGRSFGPLLRLVRNGWDNPGLLEPRGTLQAVEYVLRDGQLIRRAWARVDAAPGTPVRERVLLDGVRDVQISFLVNDRWVDFVTVITAGRPRLPELVRLRLELEGYGEMEQLFATPGTLS